MMKSSIQMKLLFLCIFLVVITTISLSTTYYIFTKQDKQRESLQRLQIAFEIIRDDLMSRQKNYAAKFEEFTQQATASMPWLLSSYQEKKTAAEFFRNPSNASFISRVGGELQKFGQLISIDRLLLYSMDAHLLMAYYKDENLEETGAYVPSENGTMSFIAADAFLDLVVSKAPFPDVPLPEGLEAEYTGNFPANVAVRQVQEGQRFGLQLLAPIFRKGAQVGVLIGKLYYTQDMTERYAALSQTEVNLFAGNHWSVGTLPSQEMLEPEALAEFISCDALLNQEASLDTVSVVIDDQRYYQGQCAFRDAQQEPVGAISVNLSQDIERRELQKLLRLVLTVSGIVSIFAIAMSFWASRKSVKFIQLLILYIRRIAKGDLPEKIAGNYKGELLEIKQNINLLIEAMNDITLLAEDIANGNITVDIKKRSEEDTLMQALQIMVNSLREVTQLAEEISEGKLNVEVSTRSEKDRLMQALDVMVSRLNGIVLDVKATADHVASGSREMNAIAENLSQGSSQQAAAAEEASASMEEMVANIRQNSDNAKVAEQMASESAHDAREGGNAVVKTIEAMKKIEERISIIQEISMQTNILSMNATIEAAKAQDYGKGFAVVASEVRALAQRSREAAEEIEQLVKSCVIVSEQAGTILQRLVPNSDKTANLVQEINAASSEQHMGAEQINNAIQQLDQVIQQNASTADEMASSSEEFSSQVELLREAIKVFAVKEYRAEEAEEAPEELMHALQTLLNTRGADEHVLMAMLKSMQESKKAEGPQRNPEEQDVKQHVATSGEAAIRTIDSEDSPEGDSYDDEFERF